MMNSAAYALVSEIITMKKVQVSDSYETNDPLNVRKFQYVVGTERSRMLILHSDQLHMVEVMYFSHTNL